MKANMKSLTRIIMRILLVSILLLPLSAALQVIHAQGWIRQSGKIINVVKRTVVIAGNDAAIDNVFRRGVSAMNNAGTQERTAALFFAARVPGTPSGVFDINSYTLGTPEYLTVYRKPEMVTSASASSVFSVGGGNGGRWTGSSSRSAFSGSWRPSSDVTSTSPSREYMLYMLAKDISDSLSSDRQSYNPPVPMAPPSFHYSPASYTKLLTPSYLQLISVATQPCRGLDIPRLEMPQLLPIPETSLKLR